MTPDGGGPAPVRSPTGVPRDLRLLLPAVAAWAGALAGMRLGTADLDAGLVLALVVPAVLVPSAAVVLAMHRGGDPTPAVLLLLLGAVGAVALLDAAAGADGPVARRSVERPLVTATATVRSDPRVTHGRFADSTLVEAEVRRMEAPGWSTTVPARVLVVLEADMTVPAYGSEVVVHGRLAPSRRDDRAAVLDARSVTLVQGPGPLHRAADRVRHGVREATGWGPDRGARLVPALVDGDDAGMPQEVVEDFQDAGLTHLTAVSGANLTLVLAFVLPLARLVGIRARGLLLVGVVCAAGFVLLARPEPSVVRAAVMGVVALGGLGVGGRRAGVRALCVAVVVLLVLSPGLATSAGFALSVLATAGILLAAPPLRRGLGAWLPGPAADAVAVPVAAQLACTPLVAVLSAEVSLVAVAANLAAAPLVGPVTVLGLVGGLLSAVWEPLGRPVGVVAAWCAEGIVVVARAGAGLPGATTPWGTGPVALTVLTVLCAALLVVLPVVLRRRTLALLLSGVLVVAVVRPAPAPSWVEGLVPGPSWPPRGWVAVACDVGQGDALVLDAGEGAAVVVDAGPDPRAVDRCLSRLRVTRVPAVVLTHFHADHVDGLAGVLSGRGVGEVQVTALEEPASGAAHVVRETARRSVSVRVPAYGETARAGPLQWQVVGPARVVGDGANDASLVLLVQSRGLRLLLTGDVEPLGQRMLAAAAALGPVDVLKVPHHGSAHQDDDLLRSLEARVALVSVGADNDYGHPSPRTVSLLRSAGAQVHRTDLEGDLAVVAVDGEPRVVARG